MGGVSGAVGCDRFRCGDIYAPGGTGAYGRPLRPPTQPGCRRPQPGVARADPRHGVRATAHGRPPVGAPLLASAGSLATFVDAGRRYYAAVLVAYLVVLGVTAVGGVVVVVLAGVGGAIALGTGLAGASLPVVAAIGVLVAVVAVGYLAAIFLVQFCGQAIVLDGRGGVDGLARSVAVVRANPRGSIGCGIVAGLLGGTVGVVLTMFSVAFYREITASVIHD